jgi:hypothetical protein
MIGFMKYLTSLDGKRREKHTALAICCDKGKALYFFDSEAPQWATLAKQRQHPPIHGAAPGLGDGT